MCSCSLLTSFNPYCMHSTTKPKHFNQTIWKPKHRPHKHSESLSSISWECKVCWVSSALSQALVSLDEQWVGFAANVLLEGQAWLLQAGQGASGLAQLLLQRRHGGIDLSHLPLQTGDAGDKEGDGKRWQMFLCMFISVCTCVCACVYLSWGSSLHSSILGLRERR